MFDRITNPVINQAVGNFTSQTTGGGTALQLFLRSFINLAFGLGGLVFLYMVIRGGYTYLTAGSDKEAVQKAVKSITTALVGAAILFSVYAISAVLGYMFGINLLNFTIPTLL